MDKGIEPRAEAPLVHGRMIYRCECCGKSWPMYLEKGIEEFGENHKPSPFTIACPYCGGCAMDVSGIQKVPEGGYVPLPDGYSYFANVGNRDCGVPTFPAREAKKEPKGEFLDLATAGDRKEAREKLRTVERETASRFRQHKDRESTWAAQKRTGQRKREWRGPWRDAKRTN